MIFALTNTRSRRGASSLEILVAFTLLGTVMGSAMPLLSAQRQYRIALDEVTNHLERLAALPQPALQTAVERLSPSEFITERLHEVELTGELAPEAEGTRITLRIAWTDSQRREAPITLSAWVFPREAPEGNE